MTTKAKNPAKATVEKVAAALDATPRTTAAVAQRSGLAPATTRKVLVVLADAGRAAKHEDSGDWFAVKPGAKPSDLGTPVPEATPENTKALAKSAAKAKTTPFTGAVPTALTKSALSKLGREDLFAWANGLALLEHLGPDDMTIGKGKLVDEVTGALLRAEVAEDHRAAATDEVARPLAELIGFEPAAKKAKATKKAAKPEAPASPLTGVAEKLAALGFSEKLARQDGALVDLLAEHGPLTRAQCFAQLGEFSDWSFRRMAEGHHSDLRFPPLLSVTGQGKARTYTLAQYGNKVVGR